MKQNSIAILHNYSMYGEKNSLRVHFDTEIRVTSWKLQYLEKWGGVFEKTEHSCRPVLTAEGCLVIGPFRGIYCFELTRLDLSKILSLLHLFVFLSLEIRHPVWRLSATPYVPF